MASSTPPVASEMSGLAFQSPRQTSPPPKPPHSTPGPTNTSYHSISPLANAAHIPQYDYNFSRTNDESSATEEHNDYTDEEMAQLNTETASSRSSISSLPASVGPSPMPLRSDAATPTKKPKLYESNRGSLSNDANGRKWRASPFRNPSSVRSIRMQDEDDLTPPHRKRTSRISRNVSTFSAMSCGSISQSKRKSGRDSRLSPQSAKGRREFPLVLLHCSLLPPAIPIRYGISDAALLQAVLPEEYWRRWDLLTDRITNDLEIQSRGVLIPHPKADYELLEERLLESLELVRPRLRSGHYYGNEHVDEVEESESEAETTVQGTKCQDCGKRVVQDIGQDRKWEVKVYAANGLMRAGAWSAAWSEMEKVDVEVSVWLPEDTRREVEERCLELGVGQGTEADEVHEHESADSETRRREVYGSAGHNSQEKTGCFFEERPLDDNGHHGHFAPPHHVSHQGSAPVMELQQLLVNYIKVLVLDKRNVTIVFLSFAVLFFALSSSASTGQSVGRHMMPANFSTPSPQTVPQCIMSFIPTVLAPSELSTAVIVPAQTDAASSTDSRGPTTSSDAVQIILEAAESGGK